MKKINFWNVSLALVVGLIAPIIIIIARSFGEEYPIKYLISDIHNNWLIVLIIILTSSWYFFWHSIHQDLLKKYPKTKEKLRYKRAGINMIIMEWIEIIKNSHPEDKEYTRTINMLRIGTIAYLSLIVYFIISVY
ncbi:MAG: hypothetical protein Q7R56_03195 [Nanoarchaeota archaeon]|nr:hypothetical protein [Nanoarchaeota archaeon]